MFQLNPFDTLDTSFFEAGSQIFLHLWNDMRNTFYNNGSSGVPHFHVKARDQTWSTGAVKPGFL